MRKERKKRFKKKKSRAVVKHLKHELKEMHCKAEKDDKRLARLSVMARSYWVRWRWELQKRKEALLTSTWMGMHINSKQVAFPNMHKIESDPKVDNVEDKQYLGCGCFKLQLYRGIASVLSRCSIFQWGESVHCVCYVYVNGFHAVKMFIFRQLPIKMFHLLVGIVSALCVLRVREWLP